MTDAYSVGCRLPQALRERYQLECVPIPDEFMQLYCITRRGGTRIPEITRYLQLLNAELEDEITGRTAEHTDKQPQGR